MISVVLVYDRKKRGGKTAAVDVRIIYMRKPYYISTGVRVRASEWKNQMVVNRPDSKELNDRLVLIVTNIQQAVNDCLQVGEALNIVAIKKKAWGMIDAAESSEDEVLTWMSEQVPMLNLAEKTHGRYVNVLTRLGEFGKFRRWSDVTVENVYAFDAWLHGRKNQDGEFVSDAAVYNYHKCLKALLNRAVRVGVLSQNPYERMKRQINKGDKATVEYLTEDEMKAFERLEPMAGTMAERAKDMFVFQMYTGLSYSDAQAFDIRNYKTVNGKWQYVGTRIKTGVPYVSELLPPVVEVLSKYGMKVPKIDNADYNKLLKVLGMAAGIRIKLHSHIARHTFATWALSHGVKIENVSKMLGHTNIVQTQRYAKVLAEDVHAEYENLAGILSGETTEH